MQYQKNHKRHLLELIVLFLLVNVAAAQRKGESGYVYGDVVYATERQGDEAIAAVGVELEIRSKKNIVKLITNEAGLIGEKLPIGKYCLLSARTANGVLLEFKFDQHKYFRIKSGKSERFGVVVLPPKS